MKNHNPTIWRGPIFQYEFFNFLNCLRRESLLEGLVQYLAFRITEQQAFIAMLEARVRVDFVAAQRELDRLDTVAGKLMAYTPTPMLSAVQETNTVARTSAVRRLRARLGLKA